MSIVHMCAHVCVHIHMYIFVGFQCGCECLCIRTLLCVFFYTFLPQHLRWHLPVKISISTSLIALEAILHNFLFYSFKICVIHTHIYAFSTIILSIILNYSFNFLNPDLICTYTNLSSITITYKEIDCSAQGKMLIHHTHHQSVCGQIHRYESCTCGFIYRYPFTFEI